MKSRLTTSPATGELLERRADLLLEHEEVDRRQMREPLLRARRQTEKLRPRGDDPGDLPTLCLTRVDERATASGDAELDLLAPRLVERRPRVHGVLRTTMAPNPRRARGLLTDRTPQPRAR